MITLLTIICLFWFILVPILVLIGLVWFVLDIFREYQSINVYYGDHDQ